MTKQKITVEYLEGRIADAKQTRKSIRKLKELQMSLSVKSIISYCDETITLCEALIKKI